MPRRSLRDCWRGRLWRVRRRRRLQGNHPGPWPLWLLSKWTRVVESSRLRCAPDYIIPNPTPHIPQLPHSGRHPIRSGRPLITGATSRTNTWRTARGGATGPPSTSAPATRAAATPPAARLTPRFEPRCFVEWLASPLDRTLAEMGVGEGVQMCCSAGQWAGRRNPRSRIQPP